MSNITLKLLEHKKITDDKTDNFLKINLSGSDINHVILNTIRRVIYELVPGYAFNVDDIIIEKNTSIYNNDYMRLRLSNFPIWNINNDESLISKVIDLEYQSKLTSFEKKKENIEDIRNEELQRNKNRLNAFVMKLDITNTTSNILNVTTDHASFMYEGKQINSPYKKPLLIIKLKPNEVFTTTCYSSFNIPLESINYLQCSICHYDQVDENNYNFTLESCKQISEKDILIRACLIIIDKLESLSSIIIKKIEEYNDIEEKDLYNISDDIIPDNTDLNEKTKHLTKGIIKIDNETHTFGNLITRYLQDDKDVLYAGYKIDQLLIRGLTIAYKTNGQNITYIFNRIKDKPIKIFKDLIEKLRNLKI